MRIFVAIFPPLEIRRKALEKALRPPLGQQVRWIAPRNAHLTLKFLGDVQEEVLGDLRVILEETCDRHATFGIELKELGAFPSARRSRIIWAGVGVGSEELRSLAADLDKALVPLGFEREERPYTPHLTLGRVRGRPADLSPLSDTMDLNFRVRYVELVESRLTERGAIYQTIEAFALRRRS